MRKSIIFKYIGKHILKYNKIDVEKYLHLFYHKKLLNQNKGLNLCIYFCKNYSTSQIITKSQLDDIILPFIFFLILTSHDQNSKNNTSSLYHNSLVKKTLSQDNFIILISFCQFQ
jgi:hypothetical protein